MKNKIILSLAILTCINIVGCSKDTVVPNEDNTITDIDVIEVDIQDESQISNKRKGTPISDMSDEYINKLNTFDEYNTKGIEYCFDDIILQVGDYSTDLVTTDIINTDEFGKVIGYNSEPEVYNHEKDDYTVSSKLYYKYDEALVNHTEFYISNITFKDYVDSVYDSAFVHYWNNWDNEELFISLFGLTNSSTIDDVEELLGKPDDIQDGLFLCRYRIAINSVPFWVDIYYNEDYKSVNEISVYMISNLDGYSQDELNVISEGLKR